MPISQITRKQKSRRKRSWVTRRCFLSQNQNSLLASLMRTDRSLQKPHRNLIPRILITLIRKSTSIAFREG